MPPAIIGTGEDGEQPALCKVLKPVPHALVRTQHELQMIDAKFEQLNTLDQKRPGLTRRELRSLLTDLNDGVMPTRKELDWVFKSSRELSPRRAK